MYDSSAISLQSLRCLAVLVVELNVTKAADRLDLTQPQLSRILARLRTITGDPLMIRTPRGMAPTPLALEIASTAAPFLARFDGLIAASEAFDPATVRMTIKVQAIDYFASTLVARAVARLEKQAPGVQVIVAPVRLTESRELLELGEADLVVSQFASPAETLYVSHLADLNPCCIVRRGHPAIGDVVTLAQYAQIPHVALSFGQDHTPFISERRLDDLLRERGLTRTKAVQVSSLLAVPIIVAGCNLIASVPRELAESLADRLGLRVLDHPLLASPFTISSVWHERTHADPRHRWFRQLMREVSREPGVFGLG